MPFVCQICSEKPLFDVASDGDRHSTSHLIGHDPEAETLYFIVAELQKNHKYDDWAYRFYIAARHVPTGSTTAIIDSSEAHRLFSHVERRIIAAVIAFATVELLKLVKPNRVTRCILLQGVPDHATQRALEKHYIVSWAFEQAGYQVTMFDQYDGGRIWIAKLRPETGDEI